MPASAATLQKAVHQALITDGPLTTLLGGPRIYDHVPRGTAPPYVGIGPLGLRDWSTGTEAGEEHAITLQVWSAEPGFAKVHEIVGRLRAVLLDADLTLDGHRLVNLRHEASEVRREGDGRTVRGTARFRAVTEPIA